MTTRQSRRGWGKLRRRASGRWDASYVGPDLQRHSAPTTYAAKMDGEFWLAQERRLIELGTWTAPALRAAATQTRSQALHSYATNWLGQSPFKVAHPAGLSGIARRPR